ncbi:glycosyltransferase family 39 protein [Litorivicinus sp.]|nr:glycosyltransferase family 39 protein [Litorivicinus sp.]
MLLAGSKDQMTLIKLDWRLFLCLFALGLIGTWIPLFDLDEGAFLEATRELLNGGHWAATTLDGMPRYDKPILSYWLQAISLWCLGFLEEIIPIEVIGRLPSVIAGALWALALGRFTSEYTQKPALGLFVALSLTSTLGILVITRAATADSLLNLWFALLFTDIARYIQKPNKVIQIRVFAWLAFGILTKGPVAVLIPIGAFGLWVVSSQQWGVLRSALSSVSGWLLLCTILTPWLIGVYDAQGIEFFRNFILRHNIERFSGNLEGHGGYLFYYLFVMPLVLLPYSGLFIAVSMRFKRFWNDPVGRFGLIWCLLVVGLVSASGTQLPHYVLYSTPPLFIFYACVVPELKHRFWALPGLLIPIGILVLISFNHLIPLPDHPRDQEQLQFLKDVISNWWWPLSITSLLLTSLALVIIILPGWKPTQRLLAMGGVQLIIVSLVLLPLLSEARQMPIKTAALIAREAGAEVVAQGIRMPSFSFYRKEITPEIAPKPGQWVIISTTHLTELQALNYRIEVKATGPGWRLIALRKQ